MCNFMFALLYRRISALPAYSIANMLRVIPSPDLPGVTPSVWHQFVAMEENKDTSLWLPPDHGVYCQYTPPPPPPLLLVCSIRHMPSPLNSSCLNSSVSGIRPPILLV